MKIVRFLVVVLIGLGLGLALGDLLREGEAEPLPQADFPVGAGDIRSFSLCGDGGGRRDRRDCVVDGDTIWLDGENIRLLGFDTPETEDFRCPEELELGTRATMRLHDLVNRHPIALIADGDRDEDVYGRKLRTLTVSGRNVADILIAEGLARRYVPGRRNWCG